MTWLTCRFNVTHFCSYFAGPNSIALLSTDVLEYLISNLVSIVHVIPCLAAYSL